MCLDRRMANVTEQSERTLLGNMLLSDMHLFVWNELYAWDTDVVVRRTERKDAQFCMRIIEYSIFAYVMLANVMELVIMTVRCRVFLYV